MHTDHALAELVQQPIALRDVFYCAARRRRMTLEQCLDDFVEVNAMTQRRRVCYRCPQGRTNRETFAASGFSGR